MGVFVLERNKHPAYFCLSVCLLPDSSLMHSVSAKVVVQKEGEKAKAATVTKAHATLVDYDILYPDGTVEEATPAHMLRDLRVCMYVHV